jgi:hypothetical protein
MITIVQQGIGLVVLHQGEAEAAVVDVALGNLLDKADIERSCKERKPTPNPHVF